MKDTHKALVEKTIKALDWESILKVNKIFKVGVGMGNYMIPGVERKGIDENITIEDLKNELECIINYMIDNDFIHMEYMQWVVYWTSDDWEFHDPYGENEEEEDDDEEGEGEPEVENIVLNPRIEVFFCPQRIMFLGEVDYEEDEEGQAPKGLSDLSKLEILLKKALEKEDYEAAAKIQREINNIKSRNKKQG